MADILLANSSHKVNVATLPTVQWTGVAGEAMADPGPVYIDPTTGKFLIADANVSGKWPAWGVATHAANLNEPLTVIRSGPMDQFDVSAMSYGAKVFLSDTAGKLADAAGTNSAVVGSVMPVFGAGFNTAADKILLVQCNNAGT